MKTLDEVITALEVCAAHVQCVDKCPYHKDGCIEYGMEKDALHYLKEYRETKKHLACLDDAEIRGDNTQIVNNPPLIWDELRTMEGKPVWVEINGYNGYWTIVHWNSNIVFEEYYDWIASPEDLMKAPLVSLDDTNFGKTWQAYRKERE